ncbi:hypothetical protein D6Z43_23835 [Pseudomonas sp. DY-1]|uniref:hypothetical protein n=1 Tax=Pseudomonas sp. DY-1 TaxID=1755504 RepID=UPI000EAA9FC6|nr:hypothetical protein [Pseudomonas sp. DY-1]AYF90028.1 hypothetical protein D6Z43_23835 [Pseudomonas sp. DY-1]
MTDKADSHDADTVAPAQKPDIPPHTQRAHALHHFLERVDAIIKKRCALLLARQTREAASGNKPQRQEVQMPPAFHHSITPRGDDELTNSGPDEAPKRLTPSAD